MICTVIYNLCMPITNNDDYVIATVHFKIHYHALPP